jgi:hypothetical protein
MRVTLLRPLSRLVLDADVQVTAVQITEVLSGPAALDFEVAPELFTRRGEDGHPVLMELGTLVVLERAWGKPVAGLVDQIDPAGARPKVSAGGVSMHLTGCPYQGPARSYIQVDPLTVYRMLWEHAQAQPAGDLGVAITGASKSSGSLGTPDSTAYLTAKSWHTQTQGMLTREEWALDQAQSQITRTFESIFGLAGVNFIGKVVKSESAPTSSITKVAWLSTSAGMGSGVIFGYDTWKKKWVRSDAATEAHFAHQALLAALPAQKDRVTQAKDRVSAAKEALDKVADQAAAPYLVNWWTNMDMGTLGADLAAAGPFEYRETATWRSDQTLALALEVGAPRVGVRRQDLVFEIGANVVGEPAPILADPYTEVAAFGSGEGSAQLHSISAATPGIRARRVKVLTNKDDRTRERVQSRARTALAAATATAGRITFETLTVMDHPNARLSQFEVGDEIRVTGTLTDVGQVDTWLRILERSTGDDDTLVTLKTEEA